MHMLGTNYNPYPLINIFLLLFPGWSLSILFTITIFLLDFSRSIYYLWGKISILSSYSCMLDWEISIMIRIIWLSSILILTNLLITSTVLFLRALSHSLIAECQLYRPHQSDILLNLMNSTYLIKYLNQISSCTRYLTHNCDILFD